MRLWSLHPRYLDSKGLVALWREALLARAVLAGETKGYKHHPQLLRFKEQADPLASINTYLWSVYEESCARGYTFNKAKLHPPKDVPLVEVTSGQLDYEASHLLAKLEQREPGLASALINNRSLDPHPLFIVVLGAVSQR